MSSVGGQGSCGSRHEKADKGMIPIWIEHDVHL